MREADLKRGGLNVSAGQEQIVKTVINGLLPVGGDAACIEQIFQTVSGLIEGRSNPGNRPRRNRQRASDGGAAYGF